jgi:hypothetical protein
MVTMDIISIVTRYYVYLIINNNNKLDVYLTLLMKVSLGTILHKEC